jgi:hypothetical protein
MIYMTFPGKQTSASEGRASRLSIAVRAALAAAVMIGFYVLAIVVVAYLFLMPGLQAYFLGRVLVQLALASIISGLLILWSILRRIDRFDPPGPRLQQTMQPDLFREIEAVARSTSEEASL